MNSELHLVVSSFKLALQIFVTRKSQRVLENIFFSFVNIVNTLICTTVSLTINWDKLHESENAFKCTLFNVHFFNVHYVKIFL